MARSEPVKDRSESDAKAVADKPVTVAEIESANARYEFQLQRAILNHQTASR
jgi:hypothetical protein